MIPVLGVDEVLLLASCARLADEYGPIVALQPDDAAAGLIAAATRHEMAEKLGSEPCIVLGIDVGTTVAIDGSDLARIEATVTHAPLASVAAAVLLRGAHHESCDVRIARESAVYSLLQAGPEFAAWAAAWTAKRAGHESPPAEQSPVLASRIGDVVDLTLHRPARGNAVNRAMRDALCEQLQVALLDSSCHVELRGAGSDFCTGGDLGEFATFPDPATSHVLRLQRSPARMLSLVRDRVHAYVHGRCIGSGIELAAFAGQVTSTEDATFRLPELSLGLVPGAGGTVSMTDRIGAERVLWMVLTGATIDAQTALAWGLVDAIV